MKNLFLLIIAALFFAACSSPKYTYNFDYYDYNSGKKPSVAQQKVEPAQTSPVEVAEVSPLILEQQPVVADAGTTPVLENKKTVVTPDAKAIAEKVASMSKSERKELKKNLKEYIKSAKKNTSDGASVNASKQMDHDLKLAAIFGAVGLVLTLLGGINTVFWVLGVIALVIGVVFFIKWLARQ